MLAFGNNRAGTFCSGVQLRNQKTKNRKKRENRVSLPSFWLEVD